MKCVVINDKRMCHCFRDGALIQKKIRLLPRVKCTCTVHPITKNIFLSGKGFDIQYQSTYKKLIDKLDSLDLSNTEYDILGNAYEEVIQDIMTGKVLGQFFTQPLVKKMMVKDKKEINAKIEANQAEMNANQAEIKAEI